MASGFKQLLPYWMRLSVVSAVTDYAVTLTLRSRSQTLTLRSRSQTLTLQSRSQSLTLYDRGVETT